MKMIIKILLLLIVLYVLVGIIYAIRWSRLYDPKYTSYPNTIETFIFNTLIWPLNISQREEKIKTTNSNTETDTPQAKRTAPPGVSPIIYNGIKFEVIALGGSSKNAVQAVDNSTGALKWQREVYKVTYRSELETDVQDIHITELSIKDDILYVVNEDGSTYKLNPESGKPYGTE